MKNTFNKKTTREMVLTIYIALLGVPNTEDKGLVGDVRDMGDDLKDLRCRHNKLSRNLWILIAALSGSGIIGANITGVIGG